MQTIETFVLLNFARWKTL